MPIISHTNNVAEQQAKMPGVEVRNTKIQWLINKENQGAPNFAMRRFVMKPEAYIQVHSHPNEHEIFILSGEGVILWGDGKESKVSQNNFLFVLGNEAHGYRNDGNKDFIFLCMIPNPDQV